MKNIRTPIIVFYLIASLILPSFNTPARAFTIGEEREVGEKLLYAVRSRFAVLDEPDLKMYLSRLGEEVIDAAGIQFFNYHFFVIENKEFNAFAAPSGLIFFHSGLIEKMEGENELVAVLAHEIGHIVKRHISSRLKKNKQITVATVGLILASLALGGGAATEALMAGGLAAGQSASLHYSRLDEEEADLLAYDWMKKLQRDPEGQVKMLQTMRRIARYRSAMVPQYLLTHPNPEARLNYVQTLLTADKAEVKSFTKGNDFQFLRFKYRVMAKSRDSSYLRKYFAAVLASPRSEELEKIMAKYGLAQLHRLDNDYDQSLKTIEEVIESLGKENELLVDKGMILLESGKTEEAYTTLKAVYDSDRSDTYAAFALAQAAAKMGLLQQAEDLYQSVLYDMPDLAKTYFELGRVSSAQKKSAETNYYLGKYYLYEGELDTAKKNFEIALNNKDLPEKLVKEAKQSLETIKTLKG